MDSDVLTVYSTPLCGDCFLLKHWLDAKRIAYREIDITRDERAREFVRESAHGHLSVPTVRFPDGRILVEPSPRALAEALLGGARG